jgi:hypothetical protein
MTAPATLYHFTNPKHVAAIKRHGLTLQPDRDGMACGEAHVWLTSRRRNVLTLQMIREWGPFAFMGCQPGDPLLRGATVRLTIRLRPATARRIRRYVPWAYRRAHPWFRPSPNMKRYWWIALEAIPPDYIEFPRRRKRP